MDFKTQKQVAHYTKKIIITEKRLNQATTKTLGKTPKEIIDDRILLEAKRILAHTNESIKEIAHHLGFEEPTNLSNTSRNVHQLHQQNSEKKTLWRKCIIQSTILTFSIHKVLRIFTSLLNILNF